MSTKEVIHLSSDPNDTIVVRHTMGKGGFGIVSKCLWKGKELAIKREKRQTHYSSLKFEAIVLSECSDLPHIPRLYHSGIAGDSYFLTMELLGKNLRSLARRTSTGTLSAATCAYIAVQCLDALQMLHSRGFVHRDVTPRNLVIGTGNQRNHVYLIDFGLSKRCNPFIISKHRTSGHPFRGTLRYASVAAHRGWELTPYDDIWGLVYSLIQLNTGSLPWNNITNQKQIFLSKLAHQSPSLFNFFPPPFSEFLTSLINTPHNQILPYDLWKGIFGKVLFPLEAHFSYLKGTDILTDDEGSSQDSRVKENFANHPSFEILANLKEKEDGEPTVNKAGLSESGRHGETGKSNKEDSTSDRTRKRKTNEETCEEEGEEMRKSNDDPDGEIQKLVEPNSEPQIPLVPSFPSSTGVVWMEWLDSAISLSGTFMRNQEVTDYAQKNWEDLRKKAARRKEIKKEERAKRRERRREETRKELESGEKSKERPRKKKQNSEWLIEVNRRREQRKRKDEQETEKKRQSAHKSPTDDNRADSGHKQPKQPKSSTLTRHSHKSKTNAKEEHSKETLEDEKEEEQHDLFPVFVFTTHEGTAEETKVNEYLPSLDEDDSSTDDREDIPINADPFSQPQSEVQCPTSPITNPTTPLSHSTTPLLVPTTPLAIPVTSNPFPTPPLIRVTPTLRMLPIEEESHRASVHNHEDPTPTTNRDQAQPTSMFDPSQSHNDSPDELLLPNIHFNPHFSILPPENCPHAPSPSPLASDFTIFRCFDSQVPFPHEEGRLKLNVEQSYPQSASLQRPILTLTSQPPQHASSPSSPNHTSLLDSTDREQIHPSRIPSPPLSISFHSHHSPPLPTRPSSSLLTMQELSIACHSPTPPPTLPLLVENTRKSVGTLSDAPVGFVRRKESRDCSCLLF
ncbi:putative Tau-tubulin kinase 2 [Blattamonas nauphoetae]|uniref:Tau-tubulin kinase 2 n=1 Tax=Blattamonas nauphoetae TaxID=2049346 RepID=A0ABQ9Y0H4_9EUKA|nr:putative Tau-tubulin kinase 2 [Blattamonas nauphoetae]